MQPRKFPLIMQLLANTIPIIGFWFFNWNMFAIIYMYWAEGFIIAFFSSVKIAMAKGIDKDGVDPISSRITTSVKYLFLRTFILLFYLIFIFAFIALPQGVLHKDTAVQNFSILLFQNSIFNNALLIYFLSQLILFLSEFIASEEYKTQPSSKYKIFFDSRTIVLHIVIVLGTFAYQYMQRYENINNRLPALSYVLILVFIKSIADIYHYKVTDTKDNSKR